MTMIPWRDTPRGTQYQTPAGDCYKRHHDETLRVWEPSLGWRPVKTTPERLIHRPSRVGSHRGTIQYQVVAVGGPWDGERVVFPEPSGSPYGLPIRVGQFYGRYNMSTGEWQDLHEETTP